jgi:hypothetical protein
VLALKSSTATSSARARRRRLSANRGAPPRRVAACGRGRRAAPPGPPRSRTDGTVHCAAAAAVGVRLPGGIACRGVCSPHPGQCGPHGLKMPHGRIGGAACQ